MYIETLNSSISTIIVFLIMPKLNYITIARMAIKHLSSVKGSELQKNFLCSIDYNFCCRRYLWALYISSVHAINFYFDEIMVIVFVSFFELNLFHSN